MKNQKAYHNIFDFNLKRKSLTMVLDKFLGLNQIEDMLNTGGDFLDVVKFGWGSSRFYDEKLLINKIALLKEGNVDACPGGTFSEIALDRGVFNEYLKQSREYGFSCIEISNGINTKINSTIKSDMIKQAKDLGFKVFSEVGKKLPNEDLAISLNRRIDEIESDKASGADKVILESRESGSVGIFNEKGEVNINLATNLFNHINPEDIIWEAPLKAQQVWLVKRLGADVNIGNVNPFDVLSLESIRRGFRADTFRENQMNSSIKVTIEHGPNAALKGANRNDIIVIIDSLRASNTILSCLEAGCKDVYPVSNIDKLKGEITIGERGGQKITGTDFGNSPVTILKNKSNFKDKSVTISTTNGTECIEASKNGAFSVIIASARNITAVANFCKNTAITNNKNITIVPAGRNNKEAIEDNAIALLLAELIQPDQYLNYLTRIPENTNLIEIFRKSESGKNLISLGYIDDISFCCELDQSRIIPILSNNKIISDYGFE